MRLSVEEFTAWTTSFYARVGEPFEKKVNWTQVAKDAQFSTTRLNVQFHRNGIDALSIINLARTHNLNPRDELAQIPRWHQLNSFTSPPSHRELLSSLHPRHILRELAKRMDGESFLLFNPDAWDSYYGRFSTWFDVSGSEVAKARLGEALNIGSASTMSSKLNSHTKFRVDEILDGFIPANMNPIYALVLAGYITDEEAGYSETLRQEALTSILNEDLLYLCQRQMRYTTKILADQQVDGRTRHDDA